MLEEKVIKFTAFTVEDIHSMFPHNVEQLNAALAIYNVQQGNISNVVKELKSAGLIPWPNYVAKVGNSWSVMWGYKGSDGSVFTVNRYGYGSRVSEAVPLDAWLRERGFTPCNEKAEDETGQIVDILGWKTDGGNTIVRPLAYPIKGRNIAHIKDNIVYYIKSMKEISKVELAEQDLQRKMKEQMDQWTQEDASSKPTQPEPVKQQGYFFNIINKGDHNAS